MHDLYQDSSHGATAPELVSTVERAEIERLTAGYVNKPQFFIDKLAEGVATIAAAFYPCDVIVRLSDFKTNEYANLIGGKPFEPLEENPMLGFRGASRYYHERYREGFALECKAITKVREEMGLRNLKVMVPFCRTVAEGRNVLDEMATTASFAASEAWRSTSCARFRATYCSPRNSREIFDGFSIGSNDLTQLTLGVDRDSEIVAPIFSTSEIRP